MFAIFVHNHEPWSVNTSQAFHDETFVSTLVIKTIFNILCVALWWHCFWCEFIQLSINWSNFRIKCWKIARIVNDMVSGMAEALIHPQMSYGLSEMKNGFSVSISPHSEIITVLTGSSSVVVFTLSKEWTCSWPGEAQKEILKCFSELWNVHSL